MSRGGARIRSGPPPDEYSGRSFRRGFGLRPLDPSGYSGEAPPFPLSSPTARESAVWEEAWATPQACVWAEERWRWRTVATWVRWSVRMEDPDASAALGAVVARLADDIGMTSAGLKFNGWKIAEPQPALPSPSQGDPAVADIDAWLRGASARDRFAPR